MNDLKFQTLAFALSRVVLWAFLLLIFSLFGLRTGTAGPAHDSLALIRSESSLVLNVKDFQATGNGQTDDSPAFVKALEKLAENGGGTLLIPPGTYLVADLSI